MSLIHKCTFTIFLLFFEVRSANYQGGRQKVTKMGGNYCCAAIIGRQMDDEEKGWRYDVVKADSAAILPAKRQAVRPGTVLGKPSLRKTSTIKWRCALVLRGKTVPIQMLKVQLMTDDCREVQRLEIAMCIYVHHRLSLNFSKG